MKKVVLVLNYLAVFCLLLSYLAPYIDPNSFWPIAFFGLFYPFFFCVNLLFILFWVFMRKKYLWLSFLAISIGYSFFFRFISLNGNDDEFAAENRRSITVLSYNVRLFDRYNWINNQNEVTRLKVIDSIKTIDPGILCIQEFFNSDSDNPPSLIALNTKQALENVHAEYTVSNGPYHWGIATFSKYPIIEEGIVGFESKSNNICIYSDIDLGGDTLRVYNAHLGSILFDYDDYELIKSVFRKIGGTEIKNRDSSGSLSLSLKRRGIGVREIAVIPVLKNVFFRLKRAFKKRAAQALAISSHISDSPYPVLLCGDFNDTPISYSYSEIIRNNLQDAFLESGIGLGMTYIGAFPSFRIDYILHSKSIISKRFRTMSSNTLSDHYPLICEIVL